MSSESGRQPNEIEAGPSDHEPAEPQEVAPPERCDSTPEAAGFAPGELDGPVHESQYRVQDEVEEQFPAEPIVMALSPEDGLPIPADESAELRTAPPFTYDTVVCVGDDRFYVAVWADEVESRLGAEGWATETVSLPPAPGQAPSAIGGSTVGLTAHSEHGALELLQPRRYIGPPPDGHDPTEIGAPRTPWRFERATVRNRFGLLVCEVPGVSVSADSGRWVLVRPVREPCRHYKTQVFGNDDQPDPTKPGARIPMANCTQRRSVGGAFMSLRDEAVYACEYRSPRDPESEEKYIHAWNRERLASTRHLTMVPLFNLPKVEHMPHVSPGPYVPPHSET